MARASELGGCLAIWGFCLLQRPGPQLGVVLLFWRLLEVLGRTRPHASSVTRKDFASLSRELSQEPLLQSPVAGGFDRHTHIAP